MKFSQEMERMAATVEQPVLSPMSVLESCHTEDMEPLAETVERPMVSPISVLESYHMKDMERMAEMVEQRVMSPISVLESCHIKDIERMAETVEQPVMSPISVLESCHIEDMERMAETVKQIMSPVSVLESSHLEDMEWMAKTVEWSVMSPISVLESCHLEDMDQMAETVEWPVTSPISVLESCHIGDMEQMAETVEQSVMPPISVLGSCQTEDMEHMAETVKQPVVLPISVLESYHIEVAKVSRSAQSGTVFMDFSQDMERMAERVEWPVERPASSLEPCHIKETSNATQIKDEGKGKVDTEVASPPAKRRKQSKVWEQFDKVKGEDGKEWAVCKHCRKRYPGSSKTAGTSNLLKHMGKCTGTRDAGGDKLCDETGGTTTLFLIRDKRSYKCNPISNPVEKANILETYQKEKEKLTSFIDNPSSGCCNVTINWWTDNNTRFKNYCLTLHFIDDGWKLKKKVLAFRRVDLDSFLWETFGPFESMLLEWSNLCKKVCTITAIDIDDQIVSDMKKWLIHQHSLPLSRKPSHVCCLVYILTAFVGKGLVEVEDVLYKVMKCISYVHDTPEHNIKFRMAVDQAREQGNIVTSEDMSVSLIFSVQILERIFGLRAAFSVLEGIDPDFASLNPKNEEWDKAANVYEFLKVLDEAVQSLSGNQSCLTTNVYFPMVCNIYKSLRKWDKDDHLAEEMKKIFDYFWNNCSLVLAIAVVLDPRFKFDIVKHWFKEIFCKDAYKHWIKIRYRIEEVYDDYSGDSNNSTDNFDMLDHLGMPCTSSNNAENCKLDKSELDRYLEEPKFPSVKDFDILNWWSVNTPKFPTLAKMARDFLAIRISTAQSDPSFHDDVMKIDPSSIDLDPENVEAFVCIRDWLQMPEKTALRFTGAKVL